MVLLWDAVRYSCSSLDSVGWAADRIRSEHLGNKDMKTDIIKRYVTLRHALEKEKTQLESRLREINQVLVDNGTRVTSGRPTLGGRRQLSAAGRARIVAAAKERWAKRRLSVRGPKLARKGRRKLSAAARARISAAATARWAKAKAAGKKSL